MVLTTLLLVSTGDRPWALGIAIDSEVAFTYCARKGSRGIFMRFWVESGNVHGSNCALNVGPHAKVCPPPFGLRAFFFLY
jgi:hypothetical protein